jgi:hypothetical protein
MILEDETFRKFGYYSKDLKGGSHRPVITKCDGCGIIKIKERRRSALLCSGCARQGYPTSEETKCKIRASLKGVQHTKERKRNNSIGHGGIGGKIKRKCKMCGGGCEVDKCQVEKGQGLFCSRECYINYQKGNSIKVKTICDYCGKIIYRDPSKMQHKLHGTFCTSACYDKWQRKNIHGENSPNWQGGKSFEPYCHKFNTKFKNYIRTKFDNVCFLCDKTEEENGRKLSVHHVNYDKACGCAETEEEKKADNKTCQFVPLCVSCNSKVNKDRDKWEKYFKEKLKNTLNGWFI